MRKIIFVVLTCAFLFVRMAFAADGSVFVITVDAANIRSGPSTSNDVIGAAYSGKSFDVLEMNADRTWVRVSAQGWIRADLGELREGIAVPVSPTQSAPITTNQLWSAYVPTISTRARAIYSQAIASGRAPHMFTVAGDSNSVHLQYVDRIVLGTYGLGQYPQLMSIAQRYGGAVWREPISVAGGRRAADMFLPDFAQVNESCAKGEGLFACELRVSNASVVFIQLGTGDKFVWREFDSHMRQMIDYAISQRVLPVLVTKADDIEQWQGGAPAGYINGVIRQLAAEYQLPLIDFWQATRTLPTIPNPELPTRPFTQNGLLDEWGYYFHLSDQAKSMRVVLTLLTLERIGG